jgi:choline kinase
VPDILPHNLAPSHRVLITTSGVGSRLGELTDFTNKSLVIVGEKPAISHIVEKYPMDTNFVITLGHFGEFVQQFLTLTYPDRTFEFVWVNPYHGPSSSLAFSIQQAKNLLQLPFIFHASDTLVLSDNIPLPDKDWIAGSFSKDATNYASFDIHSNKVSKMHDKGMLEFDFLHIGLVGIKNFHEFWNSLEKILELESNSSLNDVKVLEMMIKGGISFDYVKIDSWIDIGNSKSLNDARHVIENNHNVLKKSSESISFVEGKVIKFFYDKNICDSRVKRAQDLLNLVPNIQGFSENFYYYNFVPGAPASKVNEASLMSKLLSWSDENLWINRKILSAADFQKVCLNFYKNKTELRLDSFLNSRGLVDSKMTINNNVIPIIKEMMPAALEIIMSDLKQTRIHGDFILDNIIVNEGKFTLIDWRQDFGGELFSGDKYYDLAKLNHSLNINHEIVEKNLYEVRQNGDNIFCEILIKDYMIEMGKDFENWIIERGLSVKKVSVLTSLIWLNMAALHHHPFDHFLYYYGKYKLWKSLEY